MTKNLKKRSSSPGSKTAKLASTSRFIPLLTGGIVFVFWFFLFVLTSMYILRPNGFGNGEMWFLSVCRERLYTADFGSYTFSCGLGMSFYRILLSGFGGILSVPASLLPEKIYPQALAVLNALRLGLSALTCSFFIRKFFNSSGPLSSILSGFLYSGSAFLFCFLLHLPISDAFIFFPPVLLILSGNLQEKTPFISMRLILCCAAYFCSNAVTSIFLVPVLFLLLGILVHHKSGTVTSRAIFRQSLQILLAWGCCAIYLLPQVMQFHHGLLLENRTTRFLRQIGSDTASGQTDVSFTSDATTLLLETAPSMFIVNSLSPEFDPGADYPSHFQMLNEWIYSLWPALPVIPFQDTSVSAPVYEQADTVTFTMTTLFMDPLYAYISLPHLTHSAEVYVNDLPVSTIRYNRATMVNLGIYNVGQTLTIKIHSSHPEDIREASIQAGYINSLDWSKFTVNSNFGVDQIQLTPDGVSGESIVASDSILLTNIPYEKGWELNLNGVKTPITSYRGAFISANISNGGYLIHFHYTAPGSIAGSLVTAACFLLLAFFYFSRSSASMPRNSQIT